MNIRFGNLTLEKFAEKVGADFTAEELATLNECRTDLANFTDPDKFHIFDHPAVVVVIGKRAMAATEHIWVAADTRAKFNREVTFFPAAVAA